MRELPGGRLEVFTFKDGILGSIAHDLMLAMDRFTVQSDGDRVAARFYPESLHVLGAMRDGELDRTILSERDHGEIERNIRAKVLEIDRFPEATFEASVERNGDRARLVGVLTLRGKSQPLELQVDRRGDVWQGAVELRPTSFGVTPFKALLGAIKLQDRVLVRFRIPNPDPSW